jgi:hypothetical protein
MDDILDWMENNKLDSRRITVEPLSNGVRIAVLTGKKKQRMHLFFGEDGGVYSNDFECLRLSAFLGLNGYKIEKVGNWKEVTE